MDCSSYRTWFHFGVKGLVRGTRVKLSLVNLTYLRIFANKAYRPVFKCSPSQAEWMRVDSETSFEPTYTVYYKFSWSFDVLFNNNEVFFAYAPPFPYTEILNSISFVVANCPKDVYVYRETLTKSIDGRPVELVTLSDSRNFGESSEIGIRDLFEGGTGRCKVSKKPIVFVTARVHPGETPASFLMESLMLFLISPDPRAVALRQNFVFKLVPVLNPDGVYRGNFRMDQNGINLNRCYISPDESLHPTIYGVKLYFEYLSPMIKFYFDLHAHASKRSCFVFGNNMPTESLTETQVLAKLIELNSGFFEFSECDFSEKSMATKDPKDHHSKEGSGRVNFFKAFGVVHSYTVECSYFMPKALHLTPSPLYLKSAKRVPETPVFEKYSVGVYNRHMYNELAAGLGSAVLDIEKVNPLTRVPLSEFRFLESLRDWVRNKILVKTRQGKRPTRSLHKGNSSAPVNKSRKTFRGDIGKNPGAANRIRVNAGPKESAS